MYVVLNFTYFLFHFLYMQFTQAHKSMYAIYCSNYDSAEMHVTRLRKKKEFEQSLIVSYVHVIFCMIS